SREPTESFFVDLSNAVNATIGDGQGEGTILDDDGPPSNSVSDTRVTEPDSGTTNALFTVRLSQASGYPVTVDYVTIPGTATAGTDYVTTSGTLSFAPGERSKTIAVPVIGDTLDEPDEVFGLTLSNPSNGVLGDTMGAGLIRDNDGPALSVSDV